MFFTIYSEWDQFAALGFDEKQMQRLFTGGHPRERFDYAKRPRSFADSINEPIQVDFKGDGEGLSGTELPDLQVLGFHNGGLFLSAPAYDALKDIIKDDGAFYPARYEKGDAYIFYPMHLAEESDGLNEALCVKNEWGDIENIGFNEDAMKPYAIFKTEFDGFRNLYCTDTVKAAIEKAGLKGVGFTADLGSKFGMTQGQKKSPH